MTFLGKMLVIVQLVLSFLFMAFAGAVYTAQTNWQAAAKTATTNATNAARKAAEELTTVQADLTAANEKAKDLDNDKKTLQGQVKSLQDENVVLSDDNKRLKAQFDGQRTIAELTSQEAEERVKESQVQRVQNSGLVDSRNKILADLNTEKDKTFALDLQLKETKEKYEALLRDYSTMRSFLGSKDLPTDPKQMKVAQSPPPPLVGKIEDSRKETKGNRTFVSISIGSDDGLVIGHTLTVYRGDKYLGRIRLEDVRPDKSVGVVFETAPNSVIQKGDYVTSKL